MPSAPLYVLVVETRLTQSEGGAKLRVSEPMDRTQVEALLREVLAGERRDLYKRPRDVQALKSGEGTYLVVEKHRLWPNSLSRLTIAETTQ